MIFKEKIAIGISIIALTLSICSTILGERRANFEKERILKVELSNTLSSVMNLSKENAVLIRDYWNDKDNQTFFMNQSGNISQQNTFLIQQAMYLANKIPDIVTPVELNTIAISNAQAGDLILAEKYY